MPNSLISIMILIVVAMLYLLVEWSPLRRPWRRKRLCESELAPRRVIAGVILASLIVFVTVPLTAPLIAAGQWAKAA